MEKTRMERELQDHVIERLGEKGWKFIKINSLEKLMSHFKKTLEIRNAKELSRYNKTTLSNAEFDRLMSIIEDRHTISGFAQFILDGNQPIQTDEGEDIYLEIFDKKSWCSNTFEVVEEVAYNRIRHDLLLLINGLPVTNIELKRESVRIKNAFNQTIKYSEKLTSLTKFIQLFIISNRNETRYFANNANVNEKFVFKYSDKNNNPINDLFDFIDHFLEPCTFSKYISRYIINKTETGELIALRGYQVHGAENTIQHLSNTSKNAYLWHATGSGKTITSFKVAQIVANDLEQFDKVVFLVDRRDLDDQTVKEYNSFLQKHEQIDNVKNTRNLFKQMKSTNSKLIISTINKMNNLLKSTKKDVKKVMNQIKNLNIVFIIDECHRSQFGDMHRRIQEHFKKARYVGFTGTPIFAEDKENKKELITNDVFHVAIHKYLVQDAIKDKNVLPFYVEYFAEKNKYKDGNVQDILTSEKYVKEIVNDVLNNFDRRSLDRRFSSMMTVADIDTLIMFYEKFKSEQNRRKKENSNYKSINISATFSFGSFDYEKESVQRLDALKEIIGDFNDYTNSNEDADNAESIAKYQSRLQNIIKNTNGTPKINLTLVVDQLLTGFDAKKVNTLYVAKRLKKHSLIQAFSRTNRLVDNNKETGNIVSYVPNMEKSVKEAFKIYSDGKNSDAFVVRNADEFIKEASKIYQELTGINIQELKNNPEKNIDKAKEFIAKVNDLRELYNIARVTIEYDDKNIGASFNLDYMTNLIHATKVMKETFEKTPEWGDIKNKEGVNPFDEIDFPLVLENISKIDDNYIRSQLMEAKSQAQNNQYKSQVETFSDLTAKMKNADNPLSETFEKVLNKIQREPSKNAYNLLKSNLNKTKHEFEKEYNLNNNDIALQIKHYHLKDRYDEKLSETWIQNNHSKIQGMNFMERIKFKNNEKVKINKILDKIRIERELVE